jgi:hypothetical protein
MFVNISHFFALDCDFGVCSSPVPCPRFGTGQNLYIYKQTLRLGSTNWAKGRIQFRAVP